MPLAGSYVPGIWASDYVIYCVAEQLLALHSLWSMGFVSKLGILGQVVWIMASCSQIDGFVSQII